MFRTPFSARFAIAGFAALLAATSLSTVPVHAQFGTLFGDPPPRPPGSVPRGQQQPPPQMEDDEDVPELPQGRLLPARPAPGMGAPPPGAVQSQPLAPPPGSNVTTIPQNNPQAARPDQPPPLGVTPPAQQPGVANAPPPGAPNPNAKQAPRNAPPPAATLQPGDEVVTEPPAQKIPNKKAAFSGLDKITGRIINFDSDIGETVQFGALRVKTDACYTRPATEAANTDAFVEVDEITLQGEVKRIFSGWMFAASPGLHGVEHPIYDIWLTDCKQPEVVAAQETRPVPAAAQKRQPPPKQAPRPQPQQQLAPPPGFPAFRQ